MRKDLRIKVFVVFSAWMIVFAHNIIPHNHIHENTTGCHELVHHASPGNHNSDILQRLGNQPEDIRVCHISGFLFQNLSHDDQFLNTGRNNINAGILSAKKFSFFEKNSFIPGRSFIIPALRAPPVG